MPDYLDDPSVLTKDKLKSELLAHNVELPSGNPTKDVYVQLYLKNLTQQNHNQVPAATLDLFSSDDELPPPVVSSRSRSSGRKATRKTDKVRPDEMDVTMLSDEGLKGELLKHGVEAGPIVASTRKLYEKKLQRLLDDGPAQPKLVVTEIQVNHNGNSESDLYSDKEDEVVAAPEPEPAMEPEPEPEPAPVVERPVRSRGKTAVTTRTHSSSSQHQTREQLMDEEDDDDDEEEEEVLQVKRKSRRLSRRLQIVPEVLRPVLTSQIQLESDKRVYHRRDSPARAEPPTITSRPAQLKVEDLRLSLPKPGKDSSPQPAALLDTALLEEPEPRIDPVRPAAPRPHSAARPSRPSSPLVLLSRVDPVSFSPRCGDSPIKRPEPRRSVTDHIGSHTPDARVAPVEKIAASEQITNVEQSEVLKELFPNDINSPTGISATCRRPIRGAARRPVKYSDLWNDENRLFSPKTSKTTLSSSTTTTTTSYRESCTANRVASLPPSASPFSTAVSSSSSRLVSAAPPAGQPKAAYRSVSLWIKLFLLAVVAAFLFLVYQAMETNTINPFAAPNTDVASGSTA